MTLMTVDWGALGESSLAALVAGTGVTLFFSLAIYGAARHAEARRLGRPGMATAALLVMGVGLTASLAAVAGALWLMISE